MATDPKISRDRGEFYYSRTPRHSTYNFNQDVINLYRNQPRVPFEFYLDIKLNVVNTARNYINTFFTLDELKDFSPLVKKVDMPSFKIETNSLNQYNRKRISQTKITYDPIKIVFHDVVDGKTLKFWEMYYRYYFMDGNEPGINDTKLSPTNNGIYSNELQFDGVPITNIYQPFPIDSSSSPTSTNGNKSMLQNIVSDTLENHNFGFNLRQVQNVRNLINSIDIYQVHGGRFNKVTLVNPRISSFNHDTLDYSESAKTLELSFTLDYEYAYYVIQNMKIGGQEANNDSSMDFFKNGDYLEIPNRQFNVSLDYIQNNTQSQTIDTTDYSYLGIDKQESTKTLTESYNTIFNSDELINSNTIYDSSSSLSGLINISPSFSPDKLNISPTARPFRTTATKDSDMYLDMNRIAGNP